MVNFKEKASSLNIALLSSKLCTPMMESGKKANLMVKGKKLLLIAWLMRDRLYRARNRVVEKWFTKTIVNIRESLPPIGSRATVPTEQVPTNGLATGKMAIWKEKENKLATAMTKMRMIWENNQHIRGGLNVDSSMAKEYISGVRISHNTRVILRMDN